MGNGVSRLETDIRRMENERRADWDRMWDALQENRNEINDGKEREKLMVQLLKQFQDDQKKVETRFAQGSLNKDDFLAAINQFTSLQQATVNIIRETGRTIQAANDRFYRLFKVE